MLCARPGDVVNKINPKPAFISRVDPKEQIGLNPTFIMQHRKYKQIDDKLIKHRRWLKEFSLRTKLKKEQNVNYPDVDKERI